MAPAKCRRERTASRSEILNRWNSLSLEQRREKMRFKDQSLATRIVQALGNLQDQHEACLAAGFPVASDDPFQKSALYHYLRFTADGSRLRQDPSLAKIATDGMELYIVDSALEADVLFSELMSVLPDLLNPQTETKRSPLPMPRWKQLWETMPTSFVDLDQKFAKTIEQAFWAVSAEPQEGTGATVNAPEREMVMEKLLMEEEKERCHASAPSKAKKKKRRGQQKDAKANVSSEQHISESCATDDLCDTSPGSSAQPTNSDRSDAGFEHLEDLSPVDGIATKVSDDIQDSQGNTSEHAECGCSNLDSDAPFLEVVPDGLLKSDATLQDSADSVETPSTDHVASGSLAGIAPEVSKKKYKSLSQLSSFSCSSLTTCDYSETSSDHQESMSEVGLHSSSYATDTSEGAGVDTDLSSDEQDTQTGQKHMADPPQAGIDSEQCLDEMGSSDTFFDKVESSLFHAASTPYSGLEEPLPMNPEGMHERDCMLDVDVTPQSDFSAKLLADAAEQDSWAKYTNVAFPCQPPVDQSYGIPFTSHSGMGLEGSSIPPIKPPPGLTLPAASTPVLPPGLNRVQNQPDVFQGEAMTASADSNGLGQALARLLNLPPFELFLLAQQVPAEQELVISDIISLKRHLGSVQPDAFLNSIASLANHANEHRIV